MRASCICVLVSALLRAQSAPPSTNPKFDVVSIKRCQDSSSPSADSSPGRLSTGCARLSDTDNIGMIQRAYVRYAGGVLNSTRILPIEGVPDWAYSERFEINARSEGHPTTLMMEGPMMQAVLEDRFKLRIHRETRQAPVYELVLGKGSPKLKPFHGANCIPVLAGRPLPTLQAGERYCRRMVSPRGTLEMEAGTLREAADLLSMVVDCPVID